MRTSLLFVVCLGLSLSPGMAQEPTTTSRLAPDAPAFQDPQSLSAADEEELFSLADCPTALHWGSSVQHAWNWRGRIDTDAIWTAQDQQSLATFGDLGDTVGLRRARIGIEGQWTSESRYIAEIDLASGEVVIRDLYLGHTGSSGLYEIQAGHFREPFSLEGGTSANSFAFMERSAVNTLDPARNWGIACFSWNARQDGAFAVGIFQSGSDASDLQGGDGDDTALTARWTFLPYQADDSLLHLGLAASSRYPNRGVVLINQQPRSPLLDVGDSSTSPFLPTLRIPADFQQLMNVQLAYQSGPWTFQAEWYGSWVDQTGGPTVFLHGSYVDVSCFATGGRRSYLFKEGVFGGVQVDRPVFRHFSAGREVQTLGWGAWELTARFAYLDFADPNIPPGPLGQPAGVELAQATFGINWYLTDRLRILFNYSLAVPTEPATGQSVANLFATRLGFFW